ncbi:MAG: hypothetical protein Q7S57_02025 [bacterium]|nr:hypothetical protein [bacterium]
MMYLLGEPKFNIARRNDFFAPAGQARLCQDVLDESRTMAIVAENLRREHAAIAYALKQMSVDFRIVCRDITKVDQAYVFTLNQALGCRLAAFPGHAPSTVLYPRDFCTVHQDLKTLLLNPCGIESVVSSKDGWRIAKSVWGEGGRMLYSGRTALIGDRLRTEDVGPSRSLWEDDVQILREMGMQFGEIPFLVALRYGWGGVTEKVSYNDHLDRIGTLLSAQDKSLHFVMDRLNFSTEWLQGQNWTAREPGETVALLQRVCKPLDITVHVPAQTLCVPYALNLLQVDGGRVLMTSGDPDVEALVADIVGRENVFTTAVPIRYYPVWMNAGIRCLVSEAPEVIMRSA